MRRGDGLRPVEVVQLRRGAAAEDLRAGQRKEPDAGTLAGRAAEPPGGGTRRFHELFFTLSPDKSAIEGNIRRSLLLADKSAFNYYKDLSEKGYYNRIISGNINQMIEIDSLRCDFDKYPYSVRTFARQIILRESSVTERSLVTRCRLLDAVRSDNNPQGFIIEGFEVTENKDLQTLKR